MNAGPAVVRTRSGSHNMNDGPLDVSDLELDGLDEQASPCSGEAQASATTSSPQSSDVRPADLRKDLDGKPIIPSALLEEVKFVKMTKKRRQHIRLCLERNQKKIIWRLEGQNSRKEILIEDMTEVRTGKLARAHVEELGRPEDLDRWLTIVYYDPSVKGKGRSTHALHLLANEPGICHELSACLNLLIQDGQDFMAGISGRVYNDWSLSRLWSNEMDKKYEGRIVDKEAGQLNQADMRRCCQRCLMYMSNADFVSRFDAADVWKQGVLGRAEFMIFFRNLNEWSDVKTIFDEYNGEDTAAMTFMCFLHFLKRSQGVDVRDPRADKQRAACKAIFLSYADSVSFSYKEGRRGRESAMTFEAFKRFLLDDNSALSSLPSPSTHDRPLNEYFISSSHNTYLTGRQITGTSSTEPYVDCLKQGCRCVEIDCWDGIDGEPLVTHGRTGTSSISFLSVIKAINLWAFRGSQYPLIISLEVHCNGTQQRKMADIIIKHFGKRLVREPITSMHAGLPSPEELKNRILIKVKEPVQPSTSNPDFQPTPTHRRTRSKSEADILPTSARQPYLTAAELRVSPLLLNSPVRSATFDPSPTSPGLVSATASSDDTDCDDGASPKKKHRKTSKIMPELGILGVYTRGLSFTDFKSPASKKPFHVYSFNEGTFKEKTLAPPLKTQLDKHNRQYLMRVYPGAKRIFSDNYDPLVYWRHGVQMAALNWQTYDLGMEINDAMFAQGHDRSGYVLKPPEIREGSGDGTRKSVKFSVTIISARHLHPVSDTSTINPYIEVEIFSADNPARGMATAEGGIDVSKKSGVSGIGKPKRLRTKTVYGNGWNPEFHETLDIGVETAYPNLVYVRFTAWSAHKNDQKDPLAAHTAKFSSLQQGYRLLHLRDKRGDHTLSKLLVNIRKEGGQSALRSHVASRDQSPESPRISEDNGRSSRRIFGKGLFKRTASEKRKGVVSEPPSGMISRTMSTEK